MKTAKAWGKIPSEWDALSEADRARMMAFEDTIATMAAYDLQVARDTPEPQTGTHRRRR
jgi:hypothetical protein